MSLETKRIFKVILIVLLTLSAVTVLYLARDALLIIFAAIIITIIINRPVSYIETRILKGKRTLSLIIVFSLCLIIIFTAFLTIIPLFVEQLSIFIKSLPAVIEGFKSNEVVGKFLETYNFENQYDSILNAIKDNLKDLTINLGKISFSVAGAFFNTLITFIFVLVLFFSFISSGGEYYRGILNSIILKKENNERVDEILRKFAQITGDFFVGQSIVALLASITLSTSVFILSLIFKFDSSIVLPAWLIILIGSFIPVFGAIISVIIISILLLFYSPLSALIFIVFYILYQQVEGNLIIPKVQSNKLNMPAVLVVISIIFGIKFIGGLLSVIAIPIGAWVFYLAIEIKNYRTKKLKKS